MEQGVGTYWLFTSSMALLANMGAGAPLSFDCETETVFDRGCCPPADVRMRAGLQGIHTGRPRLVQTSLHSPFLANGCVHSGACARARSTDGRETHVACVANILLHNGAKLQISPTGFGALHTHACMALACGHAPACGLTSPKGSAEPYSIAGQSCARSTCGRAQRARCGQAGVV